MNVCLLTIEDGRTEYHDRSWASLREMLPAVEHTVTIDDVDHALGFAGAIRKGWQFALATGATHIFHAELDFMYRQPIELQAMCDALDEHPYLVQLALLRGPVNDAEIKAGGVVEQFPDSYRVTRWEGHAWLEHNRYVTTNPGLWPRWVVERGWPDVRRSEGLFGVELFAEDHKRRSAFWGNGERWVDHIGHERIGWRY